MSASIGYAIASKKDTNSYLEVLNKADEKMYTVKAQKNYKVNSLLSEIK